MHRSTTLYALCVGFLWVGACEITEPEPGANETEEFTLIDDESKADGAQSCWSSRVYTETLADANSDPADLALQAVTGVILPDSVGKTEVRRLITSAAEFQRILGVAAPAEINFQRQWLFFYSAGEQPGGSQAKVVRVRLRESTLRVTTTLAKAPTTCPSPTQQRAYTLVKFARPNIPCKVALYHRTDPAACPPPPPPAEPGFVCEGMINTETLAQLLKREGRLIVNSKSTFYNRFPSRYLGYARLQRFKRRCTMGSCAPWQEVPAQSYVAMYTSTEGNYRGAFTWLYLAYETNSRTAEVFWSSWPYQCEDAGMTKCWGDSLQTQRNEVSIGQSTTVRFYSSLQYTNERYLGTFPINDNQGNLDGFQNFALTDRCFLMSKTEKKTLSESSYDELLTKLYSIF